MTADLKVGAVYQVVTPYCVYSALALDAIQDNALVFTNINSDDCESITIQAMHIDSIKKL